MKKDMEIFAKSQCCNAAKIVTISSGIITCSLCNRESPNTIIKMSNEEFVAMQIEKINALIKIGIPSDVIIKL